jgi:hypothetical protein
MTQFKAAARTGLAILLLGLLPQAGLQAQQAPVDVSGTYTGTLSGTQVCTILSDGSQETQNDAVDITFTLTQSNGQFTADGTFVELRNSDSGTFTIVGTADASGNIAGDLNAVNSVDGDQATGFVDGSLSGDTLTLNAQVSDVPSPSDFDTCTSQLSGTFTRAASDTSVINPEVTPSSVLTAPVLLNTQVQAITSGLNARIGDVMRGISMGPRVTANGVMYQTGLNAGEDSAGYGVWASYSYSNFENDFVSTLLDGHRHNVLAGADVSPTENTLFGVAFGYEFSDIDTDFNGGNQETDGFTIAPYFGLVLSDTWSVNASVGYSNVDSDQYRTDPLTAARITSSPSADRWFGALNLNGYTKWNDWTLSGRLGMLQARSNQESFDESDGTAVGKFSTELGQWNIGGEAAYSLGAFEPYARTTYEHDFSLTRITLAGTGPQPSNDNDNFLFGLGARYFGDNGLSGNIEWYKRLGREDFDEDTFSATIRWDF